MMGFASVHVVRGDVEEEDEEEEEELDDEGDADVVEETYKLIPMSFGDGI